MKGQFENIEYKSIEDLNDELLQVETALYVDSIDQFKRLSAAFALEHLCLVDIQPSKSDWANVKACAGLTSLDMYLSPADSVALNAIGHMPKLQKLDIRGATCQAKELEALRNTPQLKHLALSLESLSMVDEDLEFFEILNDLQQLDLSGNPKVMGTCLLLLDAMQLRSLNLSQTGSKKDGLEIVASFSELLELYLDGINLESYPLDGFDGLKKLQVFHLQQALGLKNLEKLLPHMPDLLDLGLAFQTIEPNVWPIIGQLKGLKKLNIGGTGLTDETFIHLLELKQLESLWLWQTSITDQSLFKMEALQELTYLNLNGTQVTTKGLRSLSRNAKLNTIDGLQISGIGSDTEIKKELHGLGILLDIG